MTSPTSKPANTSRWSKTDLLTAGLEMLAKISIEQLTIDALCKRLDVTKGSFYHHFKGRRDYLERLLTHWADQWTEERMRAVEGTANAKERFLAIVAEGQALPHGPEISIRAWAQRDAMAQKHLERVDAVRMEYLRGLFEELTGDAERALLLSRIGYSLYVGTRMVAPPITGLEHARILHLTATELYGLNLPEPD